MKIGIIQGRLSPPTEGFQECPVNWRREFDLLQDLGLNHIEWIITKDSFSSNPFFHEDVSDYSISSVCADNLVDERIHDLDFLQENLVPICNAAIENNVECVTIPLLEDSSVEDDVIRSKFCENITNITKKYPNLLFSFEAELDLYKIYDIINLSENYRVTYDTGNMTSHGVNHEEYINTMKDKINNVHLKDRTYDAKTVRPLQGDTDFKKIFNCLKKFNYNGPFSLQTAREKDGKEIQTIKKHMKELKVVYDES